MSNKEFCNVTIEEMQSVLRAEKGWSIELEPGSREYFFQFPLTKTPHLVIKVATGITKNGNSRGCGKDAIRVFAVDTKNSIGYIKTKRVYRIGTWRNNLEKAVMDCFSKAKERRDKA